jgi:site-specific recombinase XerD
MPRQTFVKKITSDELTAQINPDNIKLMNKFLKEKSTRSSDKTIDVYRSNLIMFFTWNLLNNENKHFTKIKKLEFADFFSFLVDELKLGSARLNNIRSVLSSLSIFIEKFFDEEYPAFRNVILKTIESSPKEPRRQKTVFSEEQIEKLLNWLSDNKQYQQACWVGLAVTSGARFAELLRIDVNLLDENKTAFGDIFLITLQPIKTKGRGKSGKALYKYILREQFLPYYRKWLDERNKILLEKNLFHNSMFIKEDGSPATESTVRYWLESINKFMGIPTYCHSFRHFFVTLLSRKNIPYQLIQAIVGWNSSEMCVLYDDTLVSDKEWKELDNLK